MEEDNESWEWDNEDGNKATTEKEEIGIVGGEWNEEKGKSFGH